VGFPYPEGLQKLGSDLFAIRAEADFRGSAVYDDELELAARVEYIGSSSFRLLVGIFRKDELLTQTRLTYVHASMSEKKPSAVPDDFVGRVEAYERTKPVRK